MHNTVLLIHVWISQGKKPEIGLQFPEVAQAVEKGMFKIPDAAPTRLKGFLHNFLHVYIVILLTV